jgi:hypothetical protein
MTTVFWIGEAAAQNNPVPNDKSSWDTRWASNYGGYDNPDPRARRGYLPASFIPRQNPFYIALPYNDVTRGGTKAEAAEVVPWFKDSFVSSGRSVLKGRWLAIHYRGRVAFAQWEDVGPFRTDHWEYVFGDERPAPNRNGGAGLDVSPAVRDYLGMRGKDLADGKFVDVAQVPVLHADGAAVRLLQRLMDVAQRGFAREQTAATHGAVEVLGAQAKGRRLQAACIEPAGRAEGIDVGREVPVRPIRLDEVVHDERAVHIQAHAAEGIGHDSLGAETHRRRPEAQERPRRQQRTRAQELEKPCQLEQHRAKALEIRRGNHERAKAAAAARYGRGGA